MGHMSAFAIGSCVIVIGVPVGLKGLKVKNVSLRKGVHLRSIHSQSGKRKYLTL